VRNDLGINEGLFPCSFLFFFFLSLLSSLCGEDRRARYRRSMNMVKSVPVGALMSLFFLSFFPFLLVVVGDGGGRHSFFPPSSPSFLLSFPLPPPMPGRVFMKKKQIPHFLLFLFPSQTLLFPSNDQQIVMNRDWHRLSAGLFFSPFLPFPPFPFFRKTMMRRSPKYKAWLLLFFFFFSFLSQDIS